MIEKLPLTQSELKTYQRCKRKWFLGNYRQLQKRDEYKSPLVIGNFVHDALRDHYAGADDILEVMRRRGLELMADNPNAADDISKDLDLAIIMVEGYLEWVEETGEDFDLEVVEPERSVKVNLTDETELWGKLDARVRKRDGWTAFLEHKTVGNFVDLPSTAQIDFQLLTYGLIDFLDALERGLTGPDNPLRTDGAILNMLRKVKRTARAKPPFYQRTEVRHNVEQLRNHWRHVVALARGILETRRRLDAGEDHHTAVPPTPQQDCRWSCPFFVVCPLMDDGSDAEAVIELEYEEGDPLARYL